MPRTLEEIRKYKKRWTILNREKVVAYKQKYYAENRDLVKARSKKRELENKELINEQVRKRRSLKRAEMGLLPNQHVSCRKGHIFEEGSYYLSKNGDRRCKQCTQAKNQSRRVRDPFPKENYKILLESFGTWCPYCETAGHKLTIDHITPISKGGDNSIENLMPCCIDCNIKKYNTFIHIWNPSLFFLKTTKDLT